MRFAFEELSKKEEIKIAKQDAEKIYEDERFLVIFPKTKEASCKYGKDTRWCISATESENYFYQYLIDNNGIFYFIIDKARDKRNPLYKLALFYKRDEQYNASLDSTYDANDEQLSLEQAFSSIENEEVREKIRAAIKKHLQSKPKIEYVEKIMQAQNTSTSPEVLAVLAQDQNADVRRYVAQNTSTAPPEALALLAQDQNVSVRYSAKNTLRKLNIRVEESKNMLREFINK